jgi:hypothetical protein
MAEPLDLRCRGERRCQDCTQPQREPTRAPGTDRTPCLACQAERPAGDLHCPSLGPTRIGTTASAARHHCPTTTPTRTTTTSPATGVATGSVAFSGSRIVRGGEGLRAGPSTTLRSRRPLLGPPHATTTTSLPWSCPRSQRWALRTRSSANLRCRRPLQVTPPLATMTDYPLGAARAVGGGRRGRGPPPPCACAGRSGG